MGNPIIRHPIDPTTGATRARWEPNDHNGIRSWLSLEVIGLAAAQLPNPESIKEKVASCQVEVLEPEIGKVLITFELHRSHKGRSTNCFWSASFAQQVKENPPEGG